ncbi:ABC transporter permease [Rhodovarius lipocyclicus]|uniref:ABC transporter permease n=1 Tax=Rhodovarius lipocyclicus TaxID=268410 RepID=UPI00135C5EE0|nr:ABC transporter permease [Rhodovarius lipocyclicus]
MKYAFRALVVALLGFVLLPAVVACVSAFDTRALIAFPPQGFTWRWFHRALTYEDFQVGFVNSLYVAAIASTLAILVGSAVAYAIDRYDFAAKRVLEAVLLAPLAIPHFTIGLGALIVASQVGAARGWFVVVACHVVLVLPFVLRSLYVSLKNMDPRLESAALSLGAKPGRVLLTVTLPGLAPGLAGGWIFAAILSFNEFTASLFVTVQRTQTLPVAMYNYVREYADPSMAALSALYILLTTVVLTLANRFLGLGRILGTEDVRH